PARPWPAPRSRQSSSHRLTCRCRVCTVATPPRRSWPGDEPGETARYFDPARVTPISQPVIRPADVIPLPSQETGRAHSSLAIPFGPIGASHMTAPATQDSNLDLAFTVL